MKKVGILGGTFDPPHIGHLIIADEVCQQLALDEVWFIPTNIPPHKGAAHSAAEHRVLMLQLATEDNDRFRVHTIEVERNDVSYTIDTVSALQAMHPQIDFYFIIGADMVEYLPKWHRIDELINKISFIGVNRNGYNVHSTFPIIEVEAPLIDISSSMIRKRVNASAPYRYFLKDTVASYIKEHHLYGNK